jgi:hypothetical protein
MEWFLEVPLIVLLAATLFHAVRLERALGVLKRDRAALQTLVDGFNASSQAAEQGIGQLRAATDGAGRLLMRHIESAKTKQDDLTFLIERADSLADRLERLVRAGRPLAQDPIAQDPMAQDTMARKPMAAEPDRPAAPPPPRSAAPPPHRPRSQAEQDLMRALNLAR